ncbi:MAG: hypothetical protein ABWX67_16250 [Allosphingosinicella sp.]
MSDPDPRPIPLGDVDFFDRMKPSLDGGNYWVTISHAIHDAHDAPVNTDPIEAGLQEFVVHAPQFTLEADEIVSMHPPPAASGRFAEQLPHVVLREPALPWEREVDNGSEPTKPWLALLVLTEDEIEGPASSPTRTSSATVDSFLNTADSVYRPKATREDDVDPLSTCTFIQLGIDVFTEVMPRLDETRFLAHCRQANVGDKAALGLDPDGFFSIVLANRFPAAPTDTPATKNIVHLVSIEGLEGLLVETPDFAGCTSVALISLASWTFQCLPDKTLHFRRLCENFVASETTAGGAFDASRLALTLPVPDGSAAGAGAEVAARIGKGFVPLAYRTRTGEDSFAWYRGPLVPVVTKPLDKAAPFLTADAAMAYQPDRGVFDLSLAAAWEAGRAAALSDSAFGRRLLDFRRRAHRLTDQLLHRLSDVFSPGEIAGLSADSAVEDAFLKLLQEDLIGTVASIAGAKLDPPAAPAAADPPADPKAAVEAFLADPDTQTLLTGLVGDDLTGIAQWLARLLLLYPLPFNLLVPDERMAPVESLRFFYLDNNWTDALLDGALSLGLESSRHTFFHLMTRDLLQQAAYDGARALRAGIIGVDPPAEDVADNIITGVLIRSALVSGWPTLAVRPWLDSGATQMLRILRMDHLSPTVLLCLFSGVPAAVELAEPQEGLQLGVDAEGNVTLRNLIAPADAGANPLGRQIGTPFPVYLPDGALPYVRATGSRTLDFAKLVAAIEAALTGAGGMPAGTPLGPAQLAMQMVKAPEKILFNSKPA